MTGRRGRPVPRAISQRSTGIANAPAAAGATDRLPRNSSEPTPASIAPGTATVISSAAMNRARWSNAVPTGRSVTQTDASLPPSWSVTTSGCGASAAAHEAPDGGHQLFGLVGPLGAFGPDDAAVGVVVEQAERDFV